MRTESNLLTDGTPKPMKTRTITLPPPIREEIGFYLKANARATWSVILTKLPPKEMYECFEEGVRLSERWTLFISLPDSLSPIRVVTFCQWEPLDEYYGTGSVMTRTAEQEAQCALRRTSTMPMDRANARRSWGQEVDEGGNNITSQIEPLNA